MWTPIKKKVKTRKMMIWPLKKLEVIIFCSVQFLSKKSNQTEFKKKTKQKPKPV